MGEMGVWVEKITHRGKECESVFSDGWWEHVEFGMADGEAVLRSAQLSVRSLERVRVGRDVAECDHADA